MNFVLLLLSSFVTRGNCFVVAPPHCEQIVSKRFLSPCTQYPSIRKLHVPVGKTVFDRSAFFRLPAESSDKSSSVEEDASETNALPAEDEEQKTMSFSDAALKLKEAEEQQRAERSGGALTDEQIEKFDSKREEYDSMRDRIRARAKELDIQKSVATKKAIEEATARAMAREEAQELDLSAFGSSTEAEDLESADLTEEERESIEKYTKMSIPDQIKEEFKNVKWPTIGFALRLTGVMVIIFILTAAYILKLDEIVRTLYTDLGLIPRPDAVYDYSDLELPEGWEQDLDSTKETVTSMFQDAASDVVDAISDSVPDLSIE